MAAIDKIYVKEYYEYMEIKLWALMYYPKLLFYFYNISLTYKEYLLNKAEWKKETKARILKSHKRLGEYNTQEEAIQNLINHYKVSADYDCPYEQAKDEVLSDFYYMSLTDEQLTNLYEFPVTNTPLRIDRKLKWICPVSSVRKYLHKQCGVNPKYEWLYKIFWRGKKYFLGY